MPFTIEPRDMHHPDAQLLTDQIHLFYRDLYGAADRDSAAAEQFTPPGGLFLIGYLDGEPVACGGWRRRPDDSVEIKRMYVASSHRGRGLAGLMLAELERTAAAAGNTRVVLNTGFRQAAAIAFYEGHGYERTDDRFGVYEAIDGAFFFQKRL